VIRWGFAPALPRGIEARRATAGRGSGAAG